MSLRSNSVLATAITLCLIASAPFVFAAETATDIPFSRQSLQQDNNRPAITPTGRLIVKYRGALDTQSGTHRSALFKRLAWREKQQLKIERKLTNHKELVNTSGYQTLDQLRSRAQMLSSRSHIEYASVEYMRYPLQQPNDPFYFGSTGLGNQSYLYEGTYSMNAPDAWDITTGSSSSVIAIVDTGILPDHPEISNRSVEGLGYDFVSGDAPQDYTSANDGNGRDNNPIDPGDPCNGGPSSWHGTAVASVAAGNSNNSEGFSGIDWNARLLNARALGICGGTDADIIDAIRWSAGLTVAGIPTNPTPANVVNLSLGGATECTKAWQDVIDELERLSVTFVMAAGNESSNALRSAPANCANVVTVGSSTPGGTVDKGFSNFGLKVTIATGGRNILTASNTGAETINPDGYDYSKETGTSFSAALVSGGISLMHSLDPNLGPAKVKALLHESATPFASGSDCDAQYCGGGIFNLSKALTMLRDGNYNAARNVEQEVISNQAIQIPLQQSIDSSLSGYKDIRYFTVYVPEKGLLQAETSGNGDLYGYLLNSDLSVIALDDDSGDVTNLRIGSLVESGTYHIAVERESHRQSDRELPFTLLASLSNDLPTPFSFDSSTNNSANTLIPSDPVIIEGLDSDSIVTVINGFYTINDSDPLNTPSTIANGDVLMAIAQTSGVASSTTTVTVTVGAYSTDFSATTANNSLLNARPGLGASGCSINSQSSLVMDPLLLLLLFIAGFGIIRRHSN